MDERKISCGNGWNNGCTFLFCVVPNIRKSTKGKSFVNLMHGAC